MRTSAMKHAIELAIAGNSTLCQIVATSQEAGVILPSKLKANLQEHGYRVAFEKLKVLTGCKVLENETIVAQGMSEDENDTLLQAVYCWLKEEET